ncbi:hypothetical protein LO763_20040 [Glycomyces sp. A-F 0318]|uniref:hypothetical protein n=1 Tax=Glycomyces amatae TaxID=2881355 RepID=UPI001E4641DF|nr:hypothetical protein [Glycomyces amatae]MCD0445905.1 hypothetical protein [Glycomyces amatae]
MDGLHTEFPEPSPLRRPLLIAVNVVLAVLAFASCAGGIVVGYRNDTEGRYYEATVVDAWSETNCGWTGTGNDSHYQCTTTHRATANYVDDDGEPHTVTLSGAYAVGATLPYFAGPFGSSESRLWASGFWVLLGLAGCAAGVRLIVYIVDEWL